MKPLILIILKLKSMNLTKIFVSILLVALYFNVYGQSSLTGANVVTTGVPFLTITPGTKAAGMGDVGVATLPDIHSQHSNPAKYAFIDSKFGIGLSYSPWLTALVNDINLAYLVGYKKLDQYQTISASLRYFSLGDIFFTDYTGEAMGQHSPYEFAIDLGYTRLLSDFWAGSVAVRYIRSDLTGGQEVEGVETYPGKTYAADVAFYYMNKFQVRRLESTFSAGINIQNIGAKISYDGGNTKDFIPTNLKLGAGYTAKMNEKSHLTLSFEANKLLVPTPPIDTTYYTGGVLYPGGINSNKSVVAGIFSSFSDAPGGLKEELQEINLAVGIECKFLKWFLVRTGYFYENKYKGNRKFFTYGAGLDIWKLEFDISMIIPLVRNNPLEGTKRFSVSFLL
jgi:hypothetical protein